jgi:hypothetical protein
LDSILSLKALPKPDVINLAGAEVEAFEVDLVLAGHDNGGALEEVCLVAEL